MASTLSECRSYENSGVYVIQNLRTSKRYVGSSRNIKKRFQQHRIQLDENRHHSVLLQRAWNKHGSENFIFTKVLYCEKNDLLMYEQAFMDRYLPEYNILKVAGSRLGATASPETRLKHSEAAKRTKNFYGKKHTPESIEKISAGRKGKCVGIIFTEERKKNISMALRGKEVPPERRAQISATLSGRKQDPEVVARRAASHRASARLRPTRHRTPEHTLKVRKSKAFLEDSVVKEIRSMVGSGVALRAIARNLGVPRSSVHGISKGTMYEWVQ